MRKWFKFIISNEYNEFSKNRFLFTNNQLIDNNKNFEDIFKFENFKKNKVIFKQYNFLKKNLDPDKETLFIGSSWGGKQNFF